jgi:MFS family permease
MVLPFYAARLTTSDVGPTLAWTGWILGITSLVSVVSTPVWGRYADRYDPGGINVGAAPWTATGPGACLGVL